MALGRLLGDRQLLSGLEAVQFVVGHIVGLYCVSVREWAGMDPLMPLFPSGAL